MEFYEPAELELRAAPGARRSSGSTCAPTGPRRSPAGPGARRASRTGCCAGCATSPRSARTAPSPVQVARAALAVYDVDELGLDRLDRAVLGALVRALRRRPGRGVHAGGGGGRGAGYRRGGLRAVPGAGRDAGPHAPGPGGDGGRVGAPGSGAAARRSRRPCLRCSERVGWQTRRPTDTRRRRRSWNHSAACCSPCSSSCCSSRSSCRGASSAGRCRRCSSSSRRLQIGDVVMTTSGLRGTVVDA